MATWAQLSIANSQSEANKAKLSPKGFWEDPTTPHQGQSHMYP